MIFFWCSVVFEYIYSYGLHIFTLQTLLDKWKELQANHSVSIIFFARTYFSVADCTLEPAVVPGNSPPVSEFPVTSPTSTVGAESGVEVDPACSFNVDSRNRLYQDFYKVVNWAVFPNFGPGYSG